MTRILKLNFVGSIILNLSGAIDFFTYPPFKLNFFASPISGSLGPSTFRAGLPPNFDVSQHGEDGEGRGEEKDGSAGGKGGGFLKDDAKTCLSLRALIQ